ncbi:MAG TPA: TIGR03960 family B12-binding radical SAM protein [Syntrophomonas sp.]|nr:TIGR03960 family B12-binding radical SAM protein [Syntrophomonas sp.]HRW12166.1 TIGR03960 family B12-binding radical SAM protein [Syntrophomonas sp.]
MKERLFRDILPRVEKPARYTGSEVNMIKKDWDSKSAKMVMAFPDVYEIGMSHIGCKILYGLVNETTNHLMERSFAPWPDMEALLRQEEIPLYSLESFTPLAKFDVVGFSLQYELSITNVLNMLELGGIPLCSAQRSDTDPLVIAGGPVAFNPEPFADFFDAFLLGDGEEVTVEFLDCVETNRHLEKAALLQELAQIEGVYIPALYEVSYHADGTIKSFAPSAEGIPLRVRKRLVRDLDLAYYPSQPVVPYLGIVHDRAVLEVMRGCQRACRFCHAGMVYRPVRERSVEVLARQAEEQLKNTGYDEISLASLSTLDYSGVEILVKQLVEEYGRQGIGVSLPSLRVDAFSIELANEVQKVRKTTLTLAPEAGTQRLRDVINKNVTEEDLLVAAEAVFKSGWMGLKLYFMIGLPTESEEDLQGILELLKKVKSIGSRYSRRAIEIRASLACFVPKAHTPFQWQPQAGISSLEEKRHFMLKQKMKNVKLSFHDSRTSYLEGVMARGDRKLGEVIHRAWRMGCKFDGWSEYFSFTTWREAFAECGIDPDFYVRERSRDEIFPWDFIDIGVDKDYLWEENERAFQRILTPDCRQDGCVSCGVCPQFEFEPFSGEGA